MGHVLREHADLANTRIHAVRYREVDNTEFACKGDGWFYPVSGEATETRSPSAGQHQGECVTRESADEAFRLLNVHRESFL